MMNTMKWILKKKIWRGTRYGTKESDKGDEMKDDVKGEEINERNTDLNMENDDKGEGKWKKW